MAIATIIINDIQDAETSALDAAVQRATQRCSHVNDSMVEIFVTPRQTSGWLEYVIHCKREDGLVWMVESITQESYSAKFEFNI